MRKFAVFEGLSSVQVVRFRGVRAKVDRDVSRVVISLDVDQGGTILAELPEEDAAEEV